MQFGDSVPVDKRSKINGKSSKSGNKIGNGISTRFAKVLAPSGVTDPRVRTNVDSTTTVLTNIQKCEVLLKRFGMKVDIYAVKLNEKVVNYVSVPKGSTFSAFQTDLVN